MSFNTDSKPLPGAARRLRSAKTATAVPPPAELRPYPRALVTLGVVLFCGGSWTLIIMVVARLLRH